MNKNFLNNFIDLVIRNLKILILCVFVGAILGVFVSKIFIAPKYRATASVAISLSDEYVENATQSLVSTQAELTNALVNYFDEEYLIEMLAENLPEGLSRNYSQKELSETFITTNEMETFILNVQAVAPNASDAAILCNAFTKMSLEHTLNLIGVGFYEPVEAAIPPKSHFYPNYASSILFGGVIGALIFCAVAFLVMIFNNRVMTKNDLTEQFPNIPVLSEVAEYGKHV